VTWSTVRGDQSPPGTRRPSDERAVDPQITSRSREGPVDSPTTASRDGFRHHPDRLLATPAEHGAVTPNSSPTSAYCPLVSKVHAEARRFTAQGQTILLVGHANHEETEGTYGSRQQVHQLRLSMVNGRTLAPYSRRTIHCMPTGFRAHIAYRCSGEAE
jgi:hypothetical protein